MIFVVVVDQSQASGTLQLSVHEHVDGRAERDVPHRHKRPYRRSNDRPARCVAVFPGHIRHRAPVRLRRRRQAHKRGQENDSERSSRHISFYFSPPVAPYTCRIGNFGRHTLAAEAEGSPEGRVRFGRGLAEEGIRPL
jgi:hypothetical protein